MTKSEVSRHTSRENSAAAVDTSPIFRAIFTSKTSFPLKICSITFSTEQICHVVTAGACEGDSSPSTNSAKASRKRLAHSS